MQRKVCGLCWMTLALSRPLNGTWNVDGSEGESCRKIQTFNSRLPPPFRPSLTISQKFGGSCLISSKKKRCRLKLHLSFTAICVWHLLRVATIVGQLLRPVLRAISAHLAGGAREKCTSPTVTAWRTKVFSLFQYFLDFLANSLALVSLWGCVLTVTVHSRNYSR